MLLAGDEMGRTQRGNNNGYCQDSPLSWVDWENAARYADLVDFTAALSALRRAHPVFRRRRFFSGRPAQAGPGGLRDIVWLIPSGQEMTEADWNADYARSLAVLLNGDAITEPGTRGEPVRDNAFPAAIQRAQRRRAVRPARRRSRRRLACCHRYGGAGEPARHRGRRLACGPARRNGSRRHRPFGHGAARRRRFSRRSQPGQDDLTRPAWRPVAATARQLGCWSRPGGRAARACP